MNRLAALIDRLETATDAETATLVLTDYLARAPDPDRGAALGALLRVTPITRIGAPTLRALAADRLDPVLLDISRNATGDLAEAIALMWPGPARPEPDAPGPAAILETLTQRGRSKDNMHAQLAAWLDRLDPTARVALMQLATGRAQGVLDVPTAHAALARLGGVPVEAIEAVWHAVAPPYDELFAWLTRGAPAPKPDVRAPFRPLAPVHTLTSEERAALDATAYAVEPSWDGVRVLAVIRGDERRLYTRRGVDVSACAPEVLVDLTFEGAMEGMLIARDASGQASRTALDARLKSAKASSARLILRLHDLLEDASGDRRTQPFRARRAELAETAARAPSLEITELLEASDIDELRAHHAAARDTGARGLMLKPWDASYETAGWREWLCDPYRVLAVLLYAERGAASLSATFGVWDDDVLMPLAKVDVTDPDAAEHIDDFMSENLIDRFGPVRQVRADDEVGLVAELAFHGVERAPRRKSGVTLRDARLIALHEDAAPLEADDLDAVRALLR